MVWLSGIWGKSFPLYQKKGGKSKCSQGRGPQHSLFFNKSPHMYTNTVPRSAKGDGAGHFNPVESIQPTQARVYHRSGLHEASPHKIGWWLCLLKSSMQMPFKISQTIQSVTLSFTFNICELLNLSFKTWCFSRRGNYIGALDSWADRIHPRYTIGFITQCLNTCPEEI